MVSSIVGKVKGSEASASLQLGFKFTNSPATVNESTKGIVQGSGVSWRMKHL